MLCFAPTGIEGLGTVLCTIVDYKGARLIGQSIIPGIFTQGENSATLLYGMLEKGKAVTVSILVHLVVLCVPYGVIPFDVTRESFIFLWVTRCFLHQGHSHLHCLAAQQVLIKYDVALRCEEGADFCIYNRP